jgi:hypothetical protein
LELLLTAAPALGSVRTFAALPGVPELVDIPSRYPKPAAMLRSSEPTMCAAQQ